MKMEIKQGYDKIDLIIDDENDAARIMADLIPYCDQVTTFTVTTDIFKEEENDGNL